MFILVGCYYGSGDSMPPTKFGRQSVYLGVGFRALLRRSHGQPDYVMSCIHVADAPG